MAKAGVKIEGGDALIAAYRRLSDATKGKVLRSATLQAARPVRDEARRLVPVRTGKLKRAIGLRTKMLHPTVAEASIGFNRKMAWYGGMVELGHRLVKGKRKKDKRVIGHVPAKPYLRPALDNMAQTAEDRMRAALRRSIERAVKRGRR